MNRKTQGLIAIAGAGVGVLAVRMLKTKRIHTLPYGYGIKVKKAVTVNAPPEKLYQYWKDLSKVSGLFGNLLTAHALDDSRSHWMLHAPGGFNLEWDAEIIVDRKNEMIGWRSLQGANVDNAGYVRFERATGGRGTVVRIALQYNPPGGKMAAGLAALLGEKPETKIEEALRKFKGLMEAGEVPTTTDEKKTQPVEPVQVASEDSFPASDAPSWTGTTGPI